MNSKILVTVSRDSNFVSFRAYSRINGKSSRFVMLTDRLDSYLASDDYAFYDRDINNMLTVTKSTDNMLRFEVFYLSRSSSDKFIGYAVEFYIAKDAIMHGGKFLCSNAREHKKQLWFSEGANRIIADLNKRQKRALSKALRDNFNGYKRIEFYADLGHSFYFCENKGINGGLCMHESEFHNTLSYHFSVHT